MSETSSVSGRVQIVTGLNEATMDTERREVEVVCIRPGLSKNGNYYAPGVVHAMAPLFEGAKAFADHPTPGERPERSIRDIVGYYRAPHVDDDGALHARLKVARHADWLWSLMREAVEDGQPGLVGISIDADARVAPGRMEGRNVRVVEAITRLNSCDVVTRASAGGGIERLLQADNGSWWDQYMPANEEAATLASQAAASGISLPQQQQAVPSLAYGPVQLGPTAASEIPGGRVMVGGTYVSEGESMNGTDETAQQTRHEREVESDTSQRVRETVQELRDEVQRERKLLSCERALQKALRECTLPEPVCRRLERRFTDRVFEMSELDDAITDERALLADLTDNGIIRGMGFEKRISVGMNEQERLQKAFDQLFDIVEGDSVPALSGIREAYCTATGDHAISGITAPERLRESDVTTASFSYLLGTSMNKRLLKDFQAWPSEWQKFCNITPIKDFKQQDRIRLGAFGSLSTVPEDTAYTTLTLADTRATYSPQKRGNLVSVTRETVVNDDLYAIKQIPGKLAVSAAFTLSEFVYGFLTSTANIYDGAALFTQGAPHANSAVAKSGTGTSGAALAAAAMQSGVTAMRRQTNMAGKPIGLKPRYLIVPPELEWTAMTLTKSAGAPGTNYNDINPLLGYCEVIVSPQLTSATGWYLASDPRVIDTIEIGFVGGQVNPVLFIQDQPLFGNNFTNDVITYKVRHEYGGAVVDYRGFYQGNN